MLCYVPSYVIFHMDQMKILLCLYTILFWTYYWVSNFVCIGGLGSLSESELDVGERSL